MAQQGKGGGRGNFGRGFGGRGAARGGFGGGPGGFRGGELKLPPGWEECPPYGNPVEINKDDGKYFKVIPSKVPLSRSYDRLLKNAALNHYTINDAISSVEQQFQGRVSLVIDLTKSNRYYDFNREVAPLRTLAGNGGYYTEDTIIHCKIPCQGHNQSPDTFAVNHAAFEIQRMLSWRPDDYIIVHCTHGFNRTGYVIINTMVRLASTVGFSIARCLKRFAMARPPGIYKDAYIDDLFRYHHECRAAAQVLTPPVPSWKGLGDEDDEGEPEARE
ncbi:protein-tyrosine phosphatase-like protein [Dunaliella salina]|uniref:Protein-tyrosine phosphatase-like protein n=1 Tax=Dunaliella salina TaxID=3046 RepID=A0ABQ7H2J7_DUNSA|nr:protein-tyrosine phosphatase-like protein [Dunaliella salina]|eukprot:KAF5841082.1 protein-tyrosine phosphatase-like protein [Dunaliella salina]